MKTKYMARINVRSRRAWWSLPLACLATLLSLPVSSATLPVDIPGDPLTAGARVPPNILFILDDSGSMAFEFMPDSVPSTSTINVARQAYTRNSMAYNPSMTYQPWTNPDGTRMTGGTSYGAVYGSFNLAGGGTINLADASSCRNYNYNIAGNDENGTYNYGPSAYGSSRSYGYNQVCGGVQTFYVPKNPGNSSTFGDGANYYRYQIFTDGVIIRSWYGARTGSAPNYNQGLSGRNCSTGTGNQWRECTRVTPTGRSEADERANYATWYSYFRTRMKSAKAGASEAFSPLTRDVRVGFRTIWQRGPNHSTPIPVNSDEGRFANDGGSTNRNDWYAALFATMGRNSTPLKGALYQAGRYFSDFASNGAYGPEAKADQISCRQNFTIFTTDGYWNDNSNYTAVNEQDNVSETTAITGPGGKSYKYTAKPPYSSSDSNTLADVAMYFWKRDLRTDLDNNVPTSTNDDSHPKLGDPAFWQHMVTFTISIGLTGSTGWGSVDDVPQNATWPNPNDAEDNDRIDDLLHVAVNSHGTFVAATDPQAFTQGLQAALATIAQRTSASSNVATSAFQIRSGGKVFNAAYITGKWTGTINAWNLDSNNVPSTLAWASSVPVFTSRNVFTREGGSGRVFPTSAQLTALTRTGGPVNFAVTGALNAAYIKGDSSQEKRNGGLLRDRPDNSLGDIVNSSPFYVNDTSTLYVGANDGMLHAFNVADGKELFAYVPGLIKMSDLSMISRGDYENSHRWYVDGPVAVTDRQLTPGANYLVGSLGRGGKGMYGLNVTSPGSFGTGDVRWELAETPASNMGMVTGRPALALVNTSPSVKTAAAIVGNGVNSTNNRAVLLVVNVQTGAVIREIDTGAGSASQPNGLFAPTAILGADGKSIAYIYAGDLLGNVWKFDLTAPYPSSWTAKLLFQAKSNDGTGTPQPITGGVTVATNPVTFKRWVFFGTGRFMTVSDTNDKTPLMQGMYGFEDTDAQLQYTDLVKRTIINTGATQSGYPVRTFEPKADLNPGAKGWYLSLPADGERIVQDAQLVANALVTVSMIPATNICDATGTGYINAVDAFTGTSLGKSLFDLNNDGSTSDDSVGGVPVGSVDVGVGVPTLPIFIDGQMIVTGSAGNLSTTRTHRSIWRMVSWREFRKD